MAVLVALLEATQPLGMRLYAIHKLILEAVLARSRRGLGCNGYIATPILADI
jgi:hypothetical protein